MDPGKDDLIPALVAKGDGKIVLVVMDGLGGVRTSVRESELSEAWTPNLDKLAREGSSGLHDPVAPGITPGSGAGHLALFGYDPLVFDLGRGALSAAGVGFELKPGDVAARVNFATVDDAGVIVDRRAGRISTEENQRLVAKVLERADLGGRAKVFLVPEREHRALLVIRGEGLSWEIADCDPGKVGVAPNPAVATHSAAEESAGLVNHFLKAATEALSDEKANALLLRGFDGLREFPSFIERYGLRALGIAGYPMYIGISRILGFDTAEPQETFDNEVSILEASWTDYDFFYIHQKKTDSAGEDGDFDRKKAAIEEVDALLPRITALQPSVVCVTGDHSTPSQLKGHSWHPVPVVMWGPMVGIDQVEKFDEDSARVGGLGRVRGKDLMALMLSAAGRLTKFGA